MYRIMVVDDEPSISEIVTIYLGRMGYEVVAAAQSGHEAVAEARRLKPDLILMDIVMPGKIDGITAAEIVRNELNIPVIFVSTYTDRETIERAKRANPLDFIAKPLRLVEFEVAIEMALHKKEVEQKLKEAEEELRVKHDELEKRVKERTIELEKEIAERKQTEKALKQSEKELRQLSSRLLEAHEEESRRIGRELHDGLAQTLSAIKAWVESALLHMNGDDSTELAGSLERVVTLVQGAVGEVRGITKRLRPSTIDDLGILTTISSLCHEYEALLPGVTIGKRIDIEEDDVPDPLKIVIYRILQEAMNNISKHSDAESVQIGLAATNGRIELSIDDDGVGFDVERAAAQAQSEKGFGLTSMRERTELSGGAFTIRAEEGNGTSIRASWQG